MLAFAERAKEDGCGGAGAGGAHTTDRHTVFQPFQSPFFSSPSSLRLSPAILRRSRSRVPSSTSRRASGPAILISGPSGAGKTTLFLRLRDGGGAPSSALGTIASLSENEAPAAAPASPSTRLVDAPGHPRLRALGASHAPAAAGLVFVVDAAAFLAGKAEAADALVGLLRAGLGTKAGRRRRPSAPGGPPILLACNKADLGAAAYSPDFIRKRLEREIEAGRAAAGGTLAPPDEDGEGGSAGGAVLAPPGQAFTFEGLAKVGGGRLTAVACAAGKGEVSAVEAWLAREGF